MHRKVLRSSKLTNSLAFKFLISLSFYKLTLMVYALLLAAAVYLLKLLNTLKFYLVQTPILLTSNWSIFLSGDFEGFDYFQSQYFQDPFSGKCMACQ